MSPGCVRPSHGRSPARCASTASAAACTRPTPASTRSCPPAWSCRGARWTSSPPSGPVHASGCRSRPAAAAEAKCRQEDREGECYRTVRRLAAEHVAEIERRYPKVLRRVGGYNLDSFTPAAPGPFNLARLLVGSEGTLAVTLEAKVRLEP